MNLTLFPTITKCKTIIVPIFRQDYGSQTFFPYDKELDNSILKGIRTEYIGLPNNPISPPESLAADLSLTYPLGVTGTIFGMRVTVARYFGITLVDDKNNNILQDYPIGALTQVQAGVGTTYIRRFNAKINLQKSFISILDKTQVPPSGSGVALIYSAFTFYYKPIK